VPKQSNKFIDLSKGEIASLRSQRRSNTFLAPCKYFGAPFVVRMSDGKEFSKGYYTPFTAEAFGCSVSELEKEKPGRLKEIVAVVPKFGEATK
jgi:hypothetical protein